MLLCTAGRPQSAHASVQTSEITTWKTESISLVAEGPPKEMGNSDTMDRNTVVTLVPCIRHLTLLPF